MKKIFLLEDDKNFGSVMKSYLEINDFDVVWEQDGLYAISTFKKYEFDLCILDVMLPHVDGFEVAEKIKEINNKIPFVFLTAKSLKKDIVKGYKLGADDYIIKPFDSDVLLFKINAILRRPEKTLKEDFTHEFVIGEYKFNNQLRELECNEQKFNLSPKESELLNLLCQNKNNILARQLALTKIWGDDNYFTTRSMDVYITKLRKYFRYDNNIEIINIHSSGFSLRVKE